MGARTGFTVIAALSLGVACVTFGTAREDPPAAGSDAEAMLVEADLPPDAARVPAPAPDGGERLCASKHDLCDDFDGVQFLPFARWTRVVSPMFVSRGELVVKSAPSSLSVTVDDSVRFGYAERDFTLPANTKGIACSFAFNNGNGTDGVTFFDVLATSGGDAQGMTRVSLGVGPRSSIMASVTGPDDPWKASSIEGIELNEWYRVSARWVFGSELTVELPERRNGVPARVATTLGMGVVGLSVRVGVQYSQPAGSCQMHFDDVVCDLIP